MITAILVTAGLSLLGGGTAGFIIAKKVDKPAVEAAQADSARSKGEAQEARAEAREARAEADALRDVAQAQAAAVASVGEPIRLDAATSQLLAKNTPACSAAPESLACMVQLCWAHGQGNANRPGCVEYQGIHSKQLLGTLSTELCPEPFMEPVP